MKNIRQTAIDLLSNPRFTLSAITVLSAFSLGVAFIAQYIFGLEPCILCLYQRVPFAIVIALGLIGLALHKNARGQGVILLLSSMTFFTNAALAAYHTGVERHWWRSIFESCAVPDLGDDPNAILENILKAPSVRCDEIAWADPILSLSMTNYNVIWCLGLSIACLISLRCSNKE